MKTREQIVRELKTRDAALKARKEAEKGFNVQLSLAECRKLYEDHTGEALPQTLTYKDAAVQVYNELVAQSSVQAGTAEFMQRLETIRNS